MDSQHLGLTIIGIELPLESVTPCPTRYIARGHLEDFVLEIRN